MLYEMLTGDVPFKGPNPFAIMNDRLMNYPVPPRHVNPAITPQMQEIIYRAIEREPSNRYPRAGDFAKDLENQDKVGVSEERLELHTWQKRREPIYRKILMYVLLALIPVAVFGLLLYVAKH